MSPSFARATEGGLRFRPGHAMVEAVLAVLIITCLFLALFRLSHMLTGKILLEHAAMRVARARTVGFNDFMCLKIARVAVVPAAGKRLWPEKGSFDGDAERARLSTYLETPDASWADGLLQYEGWKNMTISPGETSVVTLKTDWFKLEGRADILDGCSYFMEQGGP